MENLNHCKRNTSLGCDNNHRHRHVNISQNLALTRNALLAIIPFARTTRSRDGSRSTNASLPRPCSSSYTQPEPNDLSSQIPCLDRLRL